MNEVLTCPKCHGTMRTHVRQGVHIEQCDMCRGVFLDYGELEALSRMGGPQQAQAQPYPAQPYPAQPYPAHPPHPGWGQHPPQPGWGRPPQQHFGGFARMLFFSS